MGQRRLQECGLGGAQDGMDDVFDDERTHGSPTLVMLCRAGYALGQPSTPSLHSGGGGGGGGAGGRGSGDGGVENGNGWNLREEKVLGRKG